jgi:hypothetical protein
MKRLAIPLSALPLAFLLAAMAEDRPQAADDLALLASLAPGPGPAAIPDNRKAPPGTGVQLSQWFNWGNVRCYNGNWRNC